MTPAAKTSLKLGLFTIVALVGLVASTVMLGIRLTGGGTVPYHTYFDESVQGLETGAPVKYRGVTIGSVTAIEIARDRRHVDVTMSLVVREIRRLGLSAWRESDGRTREGFAVPRGLRAQLGTQGITGVKFVNLDFFDPATNPIVPLPFKTPEDTIPAATSLMEGLEHSLTRTLDRLPALLDAMLAALAQINRTFEELDREHLPQMISSTIANANRAITDLRGLVRQISSADLPQRTARAVDDADKAIGKLSGLLEKLDAQANVLTSAKRAADSVDTAGQRISGTADELDRTLREIHDAARAVRDLADAIEHDPDILVKGRAPRRNP